jgi:hypothetical protein
VDGNRAVTLNDQQIDLKAKLGAVATTVRLAG